MLVRQSVAVGRFGFGGAGGGGCRRLCEEGELGGELGVGEGTLRLVFVFSFSGFQGLFVFSFICHCARTRARVALSRVGLSPASAAAMVRGEKASAIWGALRVGEGLSGLVLIGWRLVPKEPPI